MKKIILIILLGILAVALFNRFSVAVDNGFDLSNASVPTDLILSGGPPRDGIPALDRPKFISAERVDFMVGSDRVLGLNYLGEINAYPVKIMNHHEIVNDNIGGQSIAITYCPLCRSGMAYLTNIEGKKHRFAVSGLLYNSDVLLYDRETESLWSQIMSTAISGPLKGHKLTMIPLQNTSWQDWQQRHPNTRVLSTRTGYFRDYSVDPYEGYELDNNVWFPVDASDDSYPPKSMVLGIEIKGQFKAYPFSELAKKKMDLSDKFADTQLTIRYDKQHQYAVAFDGSGKEIPSVTTFWFAWYAFHPEGEVYQF